MRLPTLRQAGWVGASNRHKGERQDLLEAVLHFCYTGECLVARGSVLALLLLADRFAVPALQTACEEARRVRKVDHAASGVMMDCIDIADMHHFSKQHAHAGPARPHLLKLAPCKAVACTCQSGERKRLLLSP